MLMPSEVIIALLSLCGTFLGTFSGIRVMSYRIEQLEKRVNEYNNTKLRMYETEKKQAIDENRLAVCERRLDTLEHDKECEH